MNDEISELEKSIEIFSTDDEKLKIFAEIISNKSSIDILNLLFKNEITANEIAQKTGISLQLVKYHIEKMQKINLVGISKTEKNSKARDMNYYKASKFAIVVTPSEVTEKAKQSKLLTRSFKSIYRFFAMPIAAAAAAFSIILVSAQSNPFKQIESWYSSFNLPIDISGTGLEGTLDESFYLAKTKVDSVVSNPGAGSGTPFYDPYSAMFGFTTGDFIIIMLSIAAIGAMLSLPFFLKSYKYSKRFNKKLTH